MTFIRRSIHLNEESIGVPELERLLVPSRLRLQIACLQLGDHIVGVETGDTEIVMVKGHRVGFLLNSKEALADTQNMRCGGMLLEGHPEKLLVELRRPLDVGDPNGNVIQTDGAQARRVRGSLGAGHHRRQGSGELAARQAAALEISEHSFNDQVHVSSGYQRLYLRANSSGACSLWSR